jgi:hypothetical protein
MLLYPRIADDIDSAYDFDDRRLFLRTVDLSLPNLADLRRVADSVATLVAPAPLSQAR